jgi:uncharacterized iron-regulated membrane protein
MIRKRNYGLHFAIDTHSQLCDGTRLGDGREHGGREGAADMGAASNSTAERGRGAKLLHRLRVWARIHKWTSLACTAFLLVVCVTGLPLLFSDQIEHWLNPHTYEVLPPGTPGVSLDRLAAAGRHMYPGQVISSMFIDDDEPQVYLWMAPSWAALRADPQSGHFIRFDARTAQVLEQSKPRAERHMDFLDVIAGLHEDLFIELPGELFLGFVALLFIAAIVSGIVLYGPFMQRLRFGTVRRERSARLKWLDLHNLLGVVTLAWALVVGATGLMNELSDPLFALWQRTDVRAMLAPWHAQPAPTAARLASVQGALETARRALPGDVVTSIVFPGDASGNPHHYLLWARGATPLISRLFNPVLVDARTDRLTAIVRMPWYLRALEICRPLHFGDYGGLPLKILWALLDLVTIAVLGSGLYLWWSRRRSPIDRRVRELEEDLAAGDLSAQRG